MTATHTNTIIAAASPSTERGCHAAVQRLRWEYTLTYRRHQRQHGTHHNRTADQQACEHLRRILPIVLAHHLSGIQLTQWDDPHPAVIDSTWRHNETLIDIWWDYRPGWTIGDPTALTIRPMPAARNEAA